MTLALDWERAEWVLPVVICASVALVVATLTGRADLAVLAAPLCGALVGVWWSPRPDRRVRCDLNLTQDRCFQGETVTLQVQITAAAGVELRSLDLHVGPGVTGAPDATERLSWSRLRSSWELTAHRWGHTKLLLQVNARTPTGVYVATGELKLGTIKVFPSARPLTAIPRPVDLPDLLGVHRGRRRGQGIEFAGIRGYQPGDPLRQVNWAASARRGALHVTERLAEQAAHLVTLVDASGDISQPGASTLDLALYGALDVIQAALGQGDRAGMIALGDVLRWATPNLGRRQFYRVVETVLDVQASEGKTDPEVVHIPPTVLPRGAAVVVFSPLLDARVLTLLGDLRSRGYGVAVVDVLRAAPEPESWSEVEGLAARMWTIRRRGVRSGLADLGVPTVHWPDGVSLDEVLWPLCLRPLPGRPR